MKAVFLNSLLFFIEPNQNSRRFILQSEDPTVIQREPPTITFNPLSKYLAMVGLTFDRKNLCAGSGKRERQGKPTVEESLRLIITRD